MKKTIWALLLAACVNFATFHSAHAHFQLIYTPSYNISKAGKLPLQLIFWHPMENAHVMDMGQPEAFYSLFKGQKTDLLPTLSPLTFSGLENSANGFNAVLPVKRNGDYSVIVRPAPYYEESEDIYIQQITKIVINKGEVPTDWHQPLGLDTEIVPLNKPYGALVGSTFNGIVLQKGMPVAGAEIEIEYMSSEPDMDTHKATSANKASLPGGTIVVHTDQQGKFTFGIPKAGFWGFAALGTGPTTTFDGKELSQDAVLWIQAHDLVEE